ncbi:HAD-IIB family hydrolase [Deferribacter thermophilus]|uniref:HAD-IIB family hydrolase n=1 Tax=Deferribacter thermophilus TaxID=53573 RepID=UPI003C1748FD
MANILVFTDLDGTLLDHFTYSFADAIEAINLLKKLNIPLIFTTSKTKSEVLKLQEEIGINYPFIVENGGAIIFHENIPLLPKGAVRLENGLYALILGKKREDLISCGKKLKEKFNIKLFSEMDDYELKKVMSLPDDRLELSKKREFSEPFICFDDSLIDDMKNFCKNYGIKILKGGRFYHLVGEKQDKGVAVKKVLEIYRKILKEFVTIGVGDSNNDIDMLKEVDYPVVVKRHDGTHIKLDIENTVYTELIGPKGFNEAVVYLVNKIMNS